jgi:hypothetical protein
MNQATLHAIPTFQPSADDLALEREMEKLLVKFRATSGTGRSMRIKLRRRKIWSQYVRMHNARRPEMVAYLEQKRNSCRGRC